MKKLAQIIGLSLGLSLVPTGCKEELKVQPKTVQVQPNLNVKAMVCNGYPTAVITQDNDLKYRIENKGIQDVEPVCIPFKTNDPFHNHIKAKDCKPVSNFAKLDWRDGGIDGDLEVTGDIKPEDVTLKLKGNKVFVTVNNYTALCR
ncbi:MAG: hypothetical protein KJ939_06905 [Nanoarchaeota archaeon]|nr:hypothetical protein [Nanoarchaeota archaeon]